MWLVVSLDAFPISFQYIFKVIAQLFLIYKHKLSLQHRLRKFTILQSFKFQYRYISLNLEIQPDHIKATTD